MPEKIAIIYDEPTIGIYHHLGEGPAIEEVLGSFRAIVTALNELGYIVQTIALSPPLSLALTELERIDAGIVFNLFEGFDGWPESEAAVAGYLEDHHFRFTGSPSQALRTCETKSVVKRLISSYGIATPDWQVMYPGCSERFRLEFPCIVKPDGEHASHGLSPGSIVWNIRELTRQVEFVWQNYRQRSLVEKFLCGREFRATITEDGGLMLLPVEEITYNLPSGKPRLLTYSAKWIKGDEYFTGTGEQCPADIDQDLKNEIEIITASAFEVTGCRNYASIDLRQDENGELMVIDVNPNPDISYDGGIKLPVEALGMSYTAFIDLILSSANKRSPQYLYPEQTWTEDVKNFEDPGICEQIGRIKKSPDKIRPLSEIHG